MANEQTSAQNTSNSYPYPTALDRRARLRPKPNSATENYVYGDGLLSVLRETQGMTWINTPNISLSQEVRYQDNELTHTNGGYLSYQGTSNPNIDVTGEFVASTPTDAYYMLACIHFIRSVVKTDFGEKSTNRGLPPPVLLFSAYGPYSFNNVPVVIRNYSVDFRDDVDYVEVPIPESNYANSIKGNFHDYVGIVRSEKDKVWIPQQFTINVSLTQQPTPNFMTNEFDLNSFKRGDLIKKGGLL